MDTSWQDCPDTGRSTTGYLIFYRGGVIEANSGLQIPVAMSSCEAKVMACCSGCMAAAHIHMLLYDMKYLGTKKYENTQLALPNPPTVICVDNKAACKMTLNDKLTKHTRHVSQRFHFIREGSNATWARRAIRCSAVQYPTCCRYNSTMKAFRLLRSNHSLPPRRTLITAAVASTLITAAVACWFASGFPK